METIKEKTKVLRNTHHGHAIKRIRLDEGMTQKELGDRVCLVQQAVSTYEDQEKIEEAMLERFAKALQVPVELIKNMEEGKPMVEYIQNNTFKESNNNAIPIIANDSHIEGDLLTSREDKNIYPILEQMQKLYENSVKLYEQLLKSTEERMTALEKEISDLKKKE